MLEAAIVIATPVYLIGMFITYSYIKETLGYETGEEKMNTKIAILVWPLTLRRLKKGK